MKYIKMSGFCALLLLAAQSVGRAEFLQKTFADPNQAWNSDAQIQRLWQGIPGLERTVKGRIFISWFSGGPKEPAPENKVLLCYSDDDGKTFTLPKIIAFPKDGTRCFDPTLWIDPNGRLWYVFNRGNKDSAVHDVHARICRDPDATPPVFGPEFRVGYESPYAFRMNKPTVLSTGEWIMPVTHASEPIHEWFAGEKQLQGVGISKDQGKTWKLYGALKAPHWALENMIVELKDGRLWMLIRTGSGWLWQSFSSDRGKTWSEATASTITSPGSRFFIRRLSSGHLLLVNHCQYDKKASWDKQRSHLTAQISTDDGQTWNQGLLLDERTGVSYPDGVQDKDGLIRIVYDRDRGGAGEILMASFCEQDVHAGKNASGAVRLKQVISRLEARAPSAEKILPPDWDPKQAADQVLKGLINVCAPQVKGAHDAEMALLGERAYIVAEVNDVRPGEAANWPEVYAAMSIVNLKTFNVEKIIPFAKSEQVFANAKLPPGACFVPRILQKDARTLRCYFASEAPGQRQAQTWYLDFDRERMAFDGNIYKAKLKTAAGIFDMQPQFLHADAAAHGLTRPMVDHGLYLFDSFKKFDGKTYIALNNFPGGQNALAIVHDDLATFEVIGHYNLPHVLKLTESAVNRLPDGTWMAICRQEEGDRNYTFAQSKDGKTWTSSENRDFVTNGTNSKPVFERYNGIYYLGWQEATQIEGVHRSVFNIDVSRDGKNWERKYRFETIKSFQYPALREHQGAIYLTVTQGDSAADRKERIMFGVLEGRTAPVFPQSTLLKSDICVERLRLACQWLARIAQVKNETMVTEKDRKRHLQRAWTGAIRGEYRAATGQWEFFCPIWHTGQAIKALVMASHVLGDEFMDSAILGGEFILNNRITEGPDKGLVLAYEDLPDIINTSAILEGLDGLFLLSAKTGDAKYRDAALAAVEWVQKNAVIGDKGLLRDHYDPARRMFVPVNGVTTEGRPLMDDAVFLTAFQLTGKKEYLRTAENIAARLLADEEPSGNWINYLPCNRQTGLIHPRQCYWWGHPMLAMYRFSRDERYRELFLRSCTWYQLALRRDGGLLRNTDLDFNTDSFGHATSGAAGAISMFLDALAELGQTDRLPLIERGLSYCMRLQFTHPKDPNLHGCILEKVLEPDGTDASPYMIRDLGTIFFAQAMAKYLALVQDRKRPAEMETPAAIADFGRLQGDESLRHRQWQTKTRGELKKMLGIPSETVALAASFRGQSEWDGIVIEKWVFTAESGSQVPAVLYRPMKSAQKMPAIVLTFGHGGSKSQWQYNYAGQLYARMGLACLALDPIGEEERHPLGQLGTRAHDPQSVSDRADQAGRLIMGKLIFDSMRGIDFLLQRKDIDPQRIGVVGNSLGGAIASWMAALDPRLKMAVITGWAYDDILLTAGKLCTNLPNQRMRENLTWTGFATLPAPDCAVLIMNGDADVIIDQRKDGSAWKGTAAVVDSAGRIYERLAANEKIRYWIEAGGGHRPYFLRKEALEWIEKWLGTPATTLQAIKALPTINSGVWCDQNGVILEKLYGTSLHQRGDLLPDIGIRPTPQKLMACLHSDELGLPEFTIEGWLQQIEANALRK